MVTGNKRVPCVVTLLHSSRQRAQTLLCESATLRTSACPAVRSCGYLCSTLPFGRRLQSEPPQKVGTVSASRAAGTPPFAVWCDGHQCLALGQPRGGCAHSWLRETRPPEPGAPRLPRGPPPGRPFLGCAAPPRGTRGRPANGDSVAVAALCLGSGGLVSPGSVHETVAGRLTGVLVG